MLVYKCDCCEEVIESPHKVKMKEFDIGSHLDSSGVVYPINVINKRKLHMCDDCFKALRTLAAMVGETSVSKKNGLN